MNFKEENEVDTGLVCLDCLGKPEIALNNLGEKECLSIAMSSYYLLYR